MIKAEKSATTEFEAEIYSGYEIGLITAEERDTILGRRGFSAYLEAKKRFYAVYGFYPIKVPNYGFYGTDILNFDEVA